MQRKYEKEGNTMARPTKNITARTGHMSKAEIDKRLECEVKQQSIGMLYIL